MIVLVTLLWVCGFLPGTCAVPGEKWLPTERERLEQQQKATEASRGFQRHEFIRRWLELRMEREVAERLERAKSALLESERPAQDAERKAFVKRWLELQMEREKAAQEAQ